MSWLNSGWIDVAATAIWFGFVIAVGLRVWRKARRTTDRPTLGAHKLGRAPDRGMHLG